MPKVREDKREKLLELVRNLLALSNSPNEHEAALAAAKASELLMKYNLDIAEVEGWKAPEQADFVTGDWQTFDTRRVPPWRVRLLGYLALHNICRMTWILGSRYGNARYRLFGREASILVTQYQFEYMQRALKQAAERAWTEYLRSGINAFIRDHKTAFNNSFYQGAVQVLGVRLAALRQDEKAKENTQALIIADTQAVNEYYQTQIANITFRKHGTAGTNSSSAGFQAGRVAGQTISIHTGVKTQTPSLLS